MAIRLQPTRKARRNLALLLAAIVAFGLIGVLITVITPDNQPAANLILIGFFGASAAVMIPILLYHLRPGVTSYTAQPTSTA